MSTINVVPVLDRRAGHAWGWRLGEEALSLSGSLELLDAADRPAAVAAHRRALRNAGQVAAGIHHEIEHRPDDRELLERFACVSEQAAKLARELLEVDEAG
jgi:hypothetical protein